MTVPVYAYANNNPIHFTDPSGLSVTCTFTQSTGAFKCVDDKTGKVVIDLPGPKGFPYRPDPNAPYSGNRGVLNDPQYECIPTWGTIPEGEHTMETATKSKGPMTILTCPGSSDHSLREKRRSEG